MAQFDRWRTSSYWSSFGTMAVSCTVFEIKRDSNADFSYPLYLNCTIPWNSFEVLPRILIQNTMTGTLAVDGWTVIFGTARKGLGGLRPRSVLSLLYQM